jgi:hypothetical protein
MDTVDQDRGQGHDRRGATEIETITDVASAVRRAMMSVTTVTRDAGWTTGRHHDLVLIYY